jgi:glycosyltransferase involved in cell wall biosynthesis
MQKTKITILIATYNGEKFLRSQLDSIYNQDIENIEIYASDDGSQDNTKEILYEFQKRFETIKLNVLNGPKQGFAQNFISLTHEAPFYDGYYAFCDQDDIWLPNKLSHAVKILDEQDQSLPLLYCSRTELIDEKDSHIGFSPHFKKIPSFKNALIQNIGGGNTMVFNRKTLDLLKQTPKSNDIVSHDWWVYLLVTGSGGKVFYSPKPHILYRQHQFNLIGSNQGMKQRLKRIKGLLDGKFKTWNNIHIKELSKVSNLLTKENQTILNLFEKAKQRRFPLNLYYFSRIKLYRQTFLGNLGLLFAIITNKI